MLQNILNFVVTAVTIIIVLLLVVFLVKDVASYLKGQGQGLMKILLKIGAIILIVAFVFLAKNFTKTGEKLSDTVGTGLNCVLDEAPGMFGGN